MGNSNAFQGLPMGRFSGYRTCFMTRFRLAKPSEVVKRSTAFTRKPLARMLDSRSPFRTPGER